MGSGGAGRGAVLVMRGGRAAGCARGKTLVRC